MIKIIAGHKAAFLAGNFRLAVLTNAWHVGVKMGVPTTAGLKVVKQLAYPLQPCPGIGLADLLDNVVLDIANHIIHIGNSVDRRKGVRWEGPTGWPCPLGGNATVVSYFIGQMIQWVFLEIHKMNLLGSSC